MSGSKILDKTPYSNTGSLYTLENGLRACVDWVSVTFKNLQNPYDVISILGLSVSDFTSLDHGGRFYNKKMIFGHMSIFYEGKNEDMGVHLDITGQGCREFERTFTNKKDWSLFFALLFNWDVHFSRLDIAIDDFKGYFSLKHLVNKIKNAEVKSLFRKARNLEEYWLKDGSTSGQTLYFGKADVMFRFYNKYLERLSAGKEVEEWVTFWNRYEIQLRDDQAHTAAIHIAYKHTDIGRYAKGIFSRYLNFLTPTDDTNKSRWPIAHFWKVFLNNAEKIYLSQVAPDATIEKAENWVNRQVAPTLAMLYKAYDYDDKKIMDFITEGMDRLEDKHEDMIKRFKLDSKYKQKVLNELREKKRQAILAPRKIKRTQTVDPSKP